MGFDPTPGDNVGDGEAVADEEAGGGPSELGLEDAIEATGLVTVTVDTVLDALWSIALGTVSWRPWV